ncbi:MAG: DUF2089 family protein [Chromatiales bacterium]
MSVPHHGCPYCGGTMRISKLTCEDCGVAVEATFATPRLYRLGVEEQRLVEIFVLASGSLKRTAAILGVSYPTVRSRLDRLIERLQAEQARDEDEKRAVLDAIEAGRIPPKQGMRLIENL